MSQNIVVGPEDTLDVLRCPPPELSAEDAGRLLSEHWGIEVVALTNFPSERDVNLMVNGQYVLKVSNSAEPLEVIDMETQALRHAQLVAPDLSLPRTISTIDGQDRVTVQDGSGRSCAARLITVLPGVVAEGLPLTKELAESMGAICARASIALQGFFHPAAGRVIDWDVRRAAGVLADATPQTLQLSEESFAELKERCRAAGQAAYALPSGVNHADVTLSNVMVTDGTITGLIDFGDTHHTAHVCDLAIALTSVLRNTAPRQVVGIWELTRAVIDGYQRHRALSPDEVDILGDLVLCRLALTLTISARRGSEYEGNSAYINQWNAPTVRVLHELTSISSEELTARLHRIAGTSRAPRASRQGGSAGTDPGLLARRHHVMGGRLSPLFYERPLQIVRGTGPWLIDADGNRYLDAYNNVAVVGHAHPAVVQAVSRQLAAVNPHSRYLHPNVVELAERLVATMPDGLDTVLFTTSGTEANDLAWRLATAWTGGNGAVIAEYAYHGSSKWLADLSPNEWPAGYRPAHVATFAAPRAETGGLDHATAVDRIAAAAGELRTAGDIPALVLADIGFTSEGILDAPDPFVQGLVDGAHAQGALFLADEVQAGFGRIGPPLWRFAAHRVVPDLVTLGKPMGAGYPIGAVVTRREIADRLAEEYEYFSTFAATPAAAAASLAVLDVLQDSDILDSVVTVGCHLREQLRVLAQGHDRLGSVRGSGLIAGMDILGPDGIPDRRYARTVLNTLTRHGVLAGLTGPTGAVLKIRPPLIWESQHVDRLISALRLSLAGG
ncbi:MAG: aminotransferase class III-fold pyridoxal phosphate-dependent enzyme [Microlunatus sp.]